MSEQNTDRQDRRGWELYRRSLEKRPLHRDFDGAIDGHVANVVAAYLDNRLSESEREVFEQEMAHSPDLLNTVIAARWSQAEAENAPQADAPADLVAWAKALPNERTQAPAPARKVRRGRFGWWFRPGAAVAAATVVLALIGGVSVYLTRDTGSQIAKIEPKSAPPAAKKAAEDIGKPGNSIFTDPKKVFFDGLDVE